MRDYKQLRVWQNAMIVATQVYEVVKKLPSDERFGLISQMKRSSVSVAANIGEGCGKRTDSDFRRFLHISLGSLYELDTELKLCQLTNMLTNNDTADLELKIQKLQQSISSLIKQL